jgi:RluA family pseudouridine synthase
VKHVPAAEWELECARGLIVNRERQPISAGQIVRGGERYLHKFPNVVEPDVNGKVAILHEDEALIVVNKPAPLPMHAAGRFNRNTLQFILNAVYYPEKPRQAHRLDANTTGLVLLTRSRHFAAKLQPQFAAGTVEKVYLVRVQGEPEAEAFVCEAPISADAGEVGTRTVDLEAGLPARTEFEVLRQFEDGTTLIKARPLTGRTNQIRIHLWHLGFPVCGDRVYVAGKKFGDTQTLAVQDAPLCLHSWRIGFVHPLSQERIQFTAAAPAWAEFGESACR